MITEQQSNDYVESLRLKMRGTLLRQDSPLDVGLIKSILDTLRSLGVKMPTDEEFLRVATTALGPLVYLPNGLTAEGRILAGTHALEHVDQFHWGEYHGAAGIRPGFDMAWLYLMTGQGRVRLEQRANRAMWEVAHIGLKKPLPTVDEACAFLESGYLLSEDDKKLSHELAASWLTEVGYGIADTAAGQEGIEYIRSSGLQL